MEDGTDIMLTKKTRRWWLGVGREINQKTFKKLSKTCTTNKVMKIRGRARTTDVQIGGATYFESFTFKFQKVPE